jgi:glyoxylase-like metal-dependent hydrolase (beta-lactamase superfamily II)
VIVTSRMLRTNCTVLGRVVVDAPYFPDEIATLALPDGALAFCTHGHYDHLLLRYRGLALHGSARTVAAIRSHDPAGELADFDAVNYVERPPLEVEPLVTVEDGWKGLRLIAAPGHTADGTAVLADGVLCCGDHLSDVELPLLSVTGSRADYVATLHALAEVATDVNVPGHGTPCDRDAALRRIEADLRYLETWEIPRDRDTPRQREIHAGNLRDHG